MGYSEYPYWRTLSTNRDTPRPGPWYRHLRPISTSPTSAPGLRPSRVASASGFWGSPLPHAFTGDWGSPLCGNSLEYRCAPLRSPSPGNARRHRAATLRPSSRRWGTKGYSRVLKGDARATQGAIKGHARVLRGTPAYSGVPSSRTGREEKARRRRALHHPLVVQARRARGAERRERRGGARTAELGRAEPPVLLYAEGVL